MPGDDRRFDAAAPDLAALRADPCYMYVPDAANRDAAALCDQAEHVLKILGGARDRRLAARAGTVPCERQLAYGHYAVANARRTLNEGDRISAVAQLADAAPKLHRAWCELVDKEPAASATAVHASVARHLVSLG